MHAHLLSCGLQLSMLGELSEEDPALQCITSSLLLIPGCFFFMDICFAETKTAMLIKELLSFQGGFGPI